MDKMLPIVFIFSDFNFLTFFLIHELLHKGCQVVVITNDKNTYLKYFKLQDNLSIRTFSEREPQIPAYIFLIQGISSSNGFFSKAQIKTILSISQTYTPKTQIILPYVVNDANRKMVAEVSESALKIQNRNLGIIYLPQIYGPGMALGGSFVENIFGDISRKAPIKIPFYNFDLYLVSVHQAVAHLIKGMFSYGFGKKEIVISQKQKAFDFVREIQAIIPHANFITETSIKPLSTVSNFDFLETKMSSKDLRETIDWVMKKPEKDPSTPLSVTKPIKIKRKINKRKFKKFFLAIIILFWIIALPFILLLISAFSLKEGFREISANNLTRANLYFGATKKLAAISRLGFVFLEEGRRTSQLIYDFANASEKSIQTIELGQKLIFEISGNNSYDLSGQSNQLFLNLDDLYKEFSYLEADMNGNANFKYFAPQIDFSKIRLYLANLRDSSLQLPNLLGDGGQISYLVLLQDKNEIRPTGGLISSFGVVTFDKGKLIQKNFFDTTAADARLLGQVTPPPALSKYLGINNWSLKDSNWDPDFPTSAAKAEWFLAKETGQNVNGVIAMDENTFKKIENEGFFEYAQNDMATDIAAKNIQIFVNDSNTENSLNNLNLDGGIDLPQCMNTDNCQVNWLGVVEANLGQNIVNSNVSRSANLKVNVDANNITDNLELDFDNTSSTLPYRMYVRVLANGNPTFDRVNEKIDATTQIIQPDINNISGHIEAGVLVQIPPQQKATLSFNWKNQELIDFGKSGRILFGFRKQAGIDQMPTEINFTGFANLTQSFPTSYNTILTSDFNTKLEW